MSKRIYFFLTPAQVSRDNYAHNAVVLAEGLCAAGWEIFANISYWRERPDVEESLFRYNPDVRPSDCAVNVLTYEWMHYVNVIPYEIIENSRSIRVYLEDAGWFRTPGMEERFRIFDFVLKSHYNARISQPSNYRPWSFGISRRILAETENALPRDERQTKLLVNFGATHSYQHELREKFQRDVYPRIERILPIDETTNSRSQPPTDPYHAWMWQQTAGRHYPDYYARLRAALACACVGGQLVPAVPDDWSVFYGSGQRVRWRRAYYDWRSRFSTAPPRWNQWESWRFWESLSAGCASIMLDFEKYGVGLPVMPENGKHYIGLDLDRLDDGIERLLAGPETLAGIGAAGREWARRYYGPDAVARQFLDLLACNGASRSVA